LPEKIEAGLDPERCAGGKHAGQPGDGEVVFEIVVWSINVCVFKVFFPRESLWDVFVVGY
jgi:hypothetical protein